MIKDTTQETHHERMLTVLLHIQSHLDDELTLDSLAALAHFSTVHFHRIFKGMMGETVVEHVRRIRLERAAHRLAAGTTNVTLAGFDAGFETVESFSRAFKRIFGCPPSKYPEQHWQELYRKLPGAVHYLPGDTRSGLTIQQKKGVAMDLRIETVERMRVAFVRHTGPYNECKAAWKSLCAWAGPQGLLNNDTKYIGIGYDDPQVTPPDKIRYDACVTVGKRVEGEGKIGTQFVGGGTYAVTRSTKGLMRTLREPMRSSWGDGSPTAAKG